MDEHTGRGAEFLLDDGFAQHVAGEALGNDVEERGFLHHALLFPGHGRLVLLAPLRHLAVEDVLCEVPVAAAHFPVPGFLFAPEVIEYGGDAEGADTGADVEGVVGAAACLQDDLALLVAPLAHIPVEPVHVHLVRGHELVVVGVGLGHEPSDGPVDVALLLFVEGPDDGGFLAEAVVPLDQYLAASISQDDALLVDVPGQGLFLPADDGAPVDIDHAIVAAIVERVAAVGLAQAECRARNGLEVALVAPVLGEGAHLVGEEEERQPVLVAPVGEIRILRHHRQRELLQEAYHDERFMVLPLVATPAVVLVFAVAQDAAFLPVAKDLALHEQVHHPSDQALAAATVADAQQVEQEHAQEMVIDILHAKPRGKAAVADDGRQRDRQLLGQGALDVRPERPYGRRKVRRRKLLYIIILFHEKSCLHERLVMSVAMRAASLMRWRTAARMPALRGNISSTRKCCFVVVTEPYSVSRSGS